MLEHLNIICLKKQFALEDTVDVKSVWSLVNIKKELKLYLCYSFVSDIVRPECLRVFLDT